MPPKGQYFRYDDPDKREVLRLWNKAKKIEKKLSTSQITERTSVPPTTVRKIIKTGKIIERKTDDNRFKLTKDQELSLCDHIKQIGSSGGGFTKEMLSAAAEHVKSKEEEEKKWSDFVYRTPKNSSEFFEMMFHLGPIPKKHETFMKNLGLDLLKARSYIARLEDSIIQMQETMNEVVEDNEALLRRWGS
ncbi:uncharacterized protein KGF55_002629 [Candida pseudojiufengensis]|uniref:uncharacterized protein n=1 Tax=Candida pseudojiufengensis TaxID=497109 RepID=UPI0022245AEA|nr:uncharacterized protein KGF55_002629 [Candida pseudojiufengensis]KAI5963749.1 hypothetical protein KGF55_002629 [Candida pseudojiufengensis]